MNTHISILLRIFLTFLSLIITKHANAAIDNKVYDTSDILQEDDTLENQNGLRISVINLDIDQGQQRGEIKNTGKKFIYECRHSVVDDQDLSNLLISFDDLSCFKNSQDSKSLSYYPLMKVDNQYKQLCIISDCCINKNSSNYFYSFSIADNQQEEVNLAVFEEGFNKNGATTPADDAFESEEEYNNTEDAESSVKIGFSYSINLQDEVDEAGEILHMDINLTPCQLFNKLGDIGTLDLSSLAVLQMHPYFKNYYISIARDDSNFCIVLDLQSKNDEWSESDYFNRAYDVVIPLSGKKIIIPCNFTNDEEITIHVKSRKAVSIKNILSSFFYPITYYTKKGFVFSFNLTPETLAEGFMSLYDPLLSVGVGLAASVGKSCCNFISSSVRKGSNAKKHLWLLGSVFLFMQQTLTKASTIKYIYINKGIYELFKMCQFHNIAAQSNKFCNEKFCSAVHGIKFFCTSYTIKSSIPVKGLLSHCPNELTIKQGYYAINVSGIDCMADYLELECSRLVKENTTDTISNLCKLCDTAVNSTLWCTAPTTATPRTTAPPVAGKVTGAPAVTGKLTEAPAVTGKLTEAPAHLANISKENPTLVMPPVAEASSILTYALGAAAAVAIPIFAYSLTCWTIDGLILRKENCLKSPLTRAQKFYEWCRGKNKAVESSIDMDSNGDEKVEEDNSFINEGDEHVSTKKKKHSWFSLTRAQQFYEWCRGKNKSVESPIEMDSRSDEKVELEDDSFLSEDDENTSAKKQKGRIWSPITRAQLLYGRCRGKNKAAENSIEMDL